MVLTQVSSSCLIERRLQIHREVFHYNEDMAKFIICDYVIELDSMAIVTELTQLSHNLDFANNLLGAIIILENVIDELDGESLL
jgi:hypothetical protein